MAFDYSYFIVVERGSECRLFVLRFRVYRTFSNTFEGQIIVLDVIEIEIQIVFELWEALMIQMTTVQRWSHLTI